MTDRKVRLGDVIDDYCPRCRLVMNHGVMAIDGETVRKVRCNTCMTEHPYRHGRPPKRRKDPLKDAYEQLLGKLPKAPAAGAPRAPAHGAGDGPLPLPDEDVEEPADEE